MCVIYKLKLSTIYNSLVLLLLELLREKPNAYQLPAPTLPDHKQLMAWCARCGTSCTTSYRAVQDEFQIRCGGTGADALEQLPSRDGGGLALWWALLGG